MYSVRNLFEAIKGNAKKHTANFKVKNNELFLEENGLSVKIAFQDAVDMTRKWVTDEIVELTGENPEDLDIQDVITGETLTPDNARTEELLYEMELLDAYEEIPEILMISAIESDDQDNYLEEICSIVWKIKDSLCDMGLDDVDVKNIVLKKKGEAFGQNAYNAFVAFGDNISDDEAKYVLATAGMKYRNHVIDMLPLKLPYAA